MGSDEHKELSGKPPDGAYVFTDGQETSNIHELQLELDSAARSQEHKTYLWASVSYCEERTKDQIMGFAGLVESEFLNNIFGISHQYQWWCNAHLGHSTSNLERGDRR